MNQRIAALTFALGIIVAAACVDMTAPDGAASISEVKLPSPSVIIGDTMRDSLGRVAPIRVIAYDGAGAIVDSTTAELFITDSTPPAHLGDTNTLIGDRFGTVRIVGQFSGLQTPGVAIPVTYRPERISLGAIDSLIAPVGDTTVKGQFGIGVRVRSAMDSASQGIRVLYTLLHIPESLDPGHFPAVYLADDAGHPSTIDTTDAAGQAVRQLTVVARRLADDDLFAGRKADSAVVVISVSYAGQPLVGSPDTVVVPIVVRADFGTASARFVRPPSGGVNVSLVAFTRAQRGSLWQRAVAPGTRHREH